MPFRPYVSAVGGFAQYLCRVHSSSCQVTGLERFLQLLADEKRRGDGRGVLTYANHISVIDDPGVFGVMPMSTYQRPETTRWTLGASDVLFTNPFFSKGFERGQVISTDRGRGIFQPALDTAIEKLELGQWVHLFPEGYVNLSRQMVLRRFKWGVSRLLLESKARPRVVPIWIQGFDQMMPDPRRFPKFLPRPFAKLGVHFGEPVDRIGSALDTMLNDLRVQPHLNPLFWEGESDHIRALREEHAASGPLDGKPDGKTRPDPTDLMAAPAIPVPDPDFFPKLDPIPRPASGWPAPPPGSRAAMAEAATFGPAGSSTSPCPDGGDDTAGQRPGSPAFVARAMDARSRLAELLRRELAFLGVRSRRQMGECEGELGTLVHTLMPDSKGKTE
ncbi:unnamed protein product [Parajaminaea phylloscopi]